MFSSLSTEHTQKYLKDNSLIYFQNHLFPLLHRNLPLSEQPTCGYSSMPTPSMGMGPLWLVRSNTAQPVGAGMIGSQWTPQVTKLATLTQTQSMKSVCFSPDQGRVALDLLGQPWEQEPSVPVSTRSQFSNGHGLPWCWSPYWTPQLDDSLSTALPAFDARIKILLKMNYKLALNFRAHDLKTVYLSTCLYFCFLFLIYILLWVPHSWYWNGP